MKLWRLHLFREFPRKPADEGEGRDMRLIFRWPVPMPFASSPSLLRQSADGSLWWLIWLEV